MIREARTDDLPRLRAIQHDTLSAFSPELLERGIDGYPLVLVRETTSIVAYALVIIVGGVAYLAEFAVARRRQGRGHGTALMEALLDRLRDAEPDCIRLVTPANDERARNFYDDQGFSTVDDVPGYYEFDDGVVLTRRL